VKVGKNSKQLETQIELAQVGLSDNKSYDVIFYLTDWDYDWIDYSDNVRFNTNLDLTEDTNTTTRHAVDGSNGGFGMIAPRLTTTPVIDGYKFSIPNEWTDSAYEYIDHPNYDYQIDVKFDDNYLYVAFQPFGFLNNSDYTEIAFDTNHDGGSLENTDYKFRITNPDSPTISSYIGSGGSWSNQSLSWGGYSQLGSYEFRIPLQYVWDNGSLSKSGEMAGFQLHYEYQYPSDNGYQYWTRKWGSGDSSTYIDDPDYFGDLIYQASPLLINEVASDGKYDDEWVEIINRGPDPVHLKGIALTDQDGTDPASNFYKLWTTMVWLAPGDFAVIYAGSGTDDTTKSGGANPGWWDFYCSGSGGDNFLTDAGDDLLLIFEGNDCGLDYVAYGGGGNGCPTSNPSWGSSSSGWDNNPPGAPSSAGQTIQRMKKLYNNAPIDTNKGSDWYLNTTGNTQGKTNWLAVPEYEEIVIPIGFSISIIALGFYNKKRKVR
jgi:hypothetical protein